MIKFTDVCKAYIRYWYVILIAVIIALSCTLAITTCESTYSAKSTILVTENKDKTEENEFISQAYADSVIREMTMIINHSTFQQKVIDKVGETKPELAKRLNTLVIKSHMTVQYKQGDTFFFVTYYDDDANAAKVIASAITDVAIEQYAMKDTKALLTRVLDIETPPKSSRNKGVYTVIGILIGLVIGVVLVTFFVVFNPFVENRELLEKETGVPVLASLEKARGDK